jgi:hypothetical protein
MVMPYASTTSGEKALVEIQTMLRKFGCNKFGSMIDLDAGTVIVQFEYQGKQVSFPANFKGYAQALLDEKPWNNRMKCTLKEYQERALHQGSISVYSILRDWIKGQVTAVETGLVSFEEVFFAHLMLPNGKRVIEQAQVKNLLEGN